MDGDPGLRSVLGLSQRGDRRCHPLQRSGLCRCAQAGSEGKDGLNVCVWKAAGPRRPLLLLLIVIALPPPPSAGLEPVLTHWEEERKRRVEGGGGRGKKSIFVCGARRRSRVRHCCNAQRLTLHWPAAVHTVGILFWMGLLCP